MAEVDVSAESSAEALRRFMRRVLDDLGALERMLDDGLLESGVHRIGAEQEICLIDREFEPAPINMEVLEACGEPWLKPELGRFNLEINLDPLTLEATACHGWSASSSSGSNGCARSAAGWAPSWS